MENTTRFTLNIGINPGYGHGNELLDPVAIVARVWNEVAEKIYQECGIYVAGVMSLAKTVYRKEFGCPDGGEDTVLVTGLRNPEFQPIDSHWRAAVRDIVLGVAESLQQTTAYLTFDEVLFDYLKLRKKAECERSES